MSTKRKRIPVIVIIVLIIAIPALLATLAFYWVGNYYRDDDRIYPNITIAGVDVSWLTREEALHILDLSDLEQRGSSAEVSIRFPDSSKLKITGEDISLTHDARQIVADAYSIGRGRGFVMDTISFIRRLNDDMLYLNIDHEYDLDILHSRVDNFADNYNNKLVTTEPLIYYDSITMTKGAGQALADALILKDIAYIGLFESFETGHPVEVEYILPETITDWQKIVEIHEGIHVPVKSAEFDRSTWLVEDCVIGIDFDVFYAIALLNDTETGKTATFNVEYIQPEITREYLETLLFRDLIGECTTRVHGGPDRVTNIRLSAEAIDGTILEPGEEFSYNETVGVRHSSRGFRPAGAYVGGETVTVIGGGVCQTSSTMYSAIKDTEILVTERHPHSKPVPYLPRGRDATVFWNRLDFRFVNNTDFPLRIEVELEERALTARFIGTIIDDFPTLSPPLPAG